MMKNSIEQILAILQREHYSEKTSPFTSEVALNLDEYELKCTKGKTKRDNTVDFVVCLDKNKLLLVEAKLNVVNVENIRNIFDKISHSKDLLNVQPTPFLIIQMSLYYWVMINFNRIAIGCVECSYRGV